MLIIGHPDPTVDVQIGSSTITLRRTRARQHYRQMTVIAQLRAASARQLTRYQEAQALAEQDDPRALVLMDEIMAGGGYPAELLDEIYSELADAIQSVDHASVNLDVDTLDSAVSTVSEIIQIYMAWHAACEPSDAARKKNPDSPDGDGAP